MFGTNNMPQRVFAAENGGNPGNVNIAGQVTETLTLFLEAQEKTKALQSWIEDNNSYPGIEKIKENVSIHNDGLHIKTSLGVKTLGWKGHTIGGINTLGDNLAKQKYKIEELGAIIEALGGKELKLQDGYKIGGPEISKFLSEIAGLELGRFSWSSSELIEVEAHAWGLYVRFQGSVCGLKSSSWW